MVPCHSKVKEFVDGLRKVKWRFRRNVILFKEATFIKILRDVKRVNTVSLFPSHFFDEKVACERGLKICIQGLKIDRESTNNRDRIKGEMTKSYTKTQLQTWLINITAKCTRE